MWTSLEVTQRRLGPISLQREEDTLRRSTVASVNGWRASTCIPRRQQGQPTCQSDLVLVGNAQAILDLPAVRGLADGGYEGSGSAVWDDSAIDGEEFLETILHVLLEARVSVDRLLAQCVAECAT